MTDQLLVRCAAAGWLAAVAFASTQGLAQNQPPRPSQPPAQAAPPQQPPRALPAPPPAPPAPYQPVTIGAPPPIKDPGLEALRKQIVEIAQRKDRNALARLVVAQGFFWDAEGGDKADKRQPGIDNLVRALNLLAADGSGWEMLAGYASDPTGSTPPHRGNVTCAPGDPVFDGQALEALVKATRTEDIDWGFPVQPGIEVRASAQPNSPVIDRLGMYFVRVMMENLQSAPPPSDQAPPPLRIVTPSGKVGYVPAEAIAPLGSDHLCYVKDSSGAWKIAGFIGG